MPELVNKETLKTLVPSQSLNNENFQELARKAVLEELVAGKLLFKKGETDRKSVYLLEGEVELVGEQGVMGVVKGGSKESKHPMANKQPRQVTARTKTNCKITRFDTDLLDILLTWDQVSGIEVGHIEDEGGDSGDWMTRILQSQAFMRIPPANIQHMFMRLQEFQAKAGQQIIKQGGEGDFYYIISRGKARVTRASATGANVTLATLNSGDAFGEEALLSEGKRNATVTMESDGILMRLSRKDFDELLKAPMLDDVNLDQAKEMLKKGAVLMDVRMESEHKAGSIKGSVNVPLFMLRLKIENLDSSKKYICYCETGRRSQAAAYIMSEQGFDSYVLRGGLQAISQASNKGG